MTLRRDDLDLEQRPPAGNTTAPGTPKPLTARPTPSPTPTDIGPEQAEVEQLLAQHAAGQLEPQQAAMPDVPDDLSDAERRVLEHFQLVAGLRLRVDEDRPVPYAVEWAAKHVGISVRHASRVLRRLVERGVLAHVGNMPRRKFSEGTRLYVPNVEAATVGVEPRVVVEPQREYDDRRHVPRAEVPVDHRVLRPLCDDVPPASGDGAGTHRLSLRLVCGREAA